MFSTSSAAPAQEAPTGNKYLSVGLNEGVTITNVFTGESSKKGTPFLALTISKGEESTQDISFYMSEKAMPISMRNIKHILVDGLGVDATKLDAINEPTLEAYATKLSAITPKNKPFNLVFNGEEYQKQDGTVGTRRVLGYAPFAEAAGTTPTKLKFDAAKQIKKMATPDATPTGAGTSEADLSLLPF